MSGADDLVLDTNVLLYNFDNNEPVKGPAAQALLPQVFAAGKPVLSVQVFSEFYWNATRKLATPLTPVRARAAVQYYYSMCRVAPLTWDIYEKALDAVDTHGMPLWDALIFAVAVLHGAKAIVSEDFQHRSVLENITFINPFAADFVITDILRP
jgi:predicted nucleic acid-binding protein